MKRYDLNDGNMFRHVMESEYGDYVEYADIKPLIDALKTISAMPVDPCSPPVIEACLRRAKELAATAIANWRDK